MLVAKDILKLDISEGRTTLKLCKRGELYSIHISTGSAKRTYGYLSYQPVTHEVQESLLGSPLYIHRQSCYLFGRERRVADVPTDHPSCSKQHSVLQFRLTEKEGSDGMMASQVWAFISSFNSDDLPVYIEQCYSTQAEHGTSCMLSCAALL